MGFFGFTLMIKVFAVGVLFGTFIVPLLWNDPSIAINTGHEVVDRSVDVYEAIRGES